MPVGFLDRIARGGPKKKNCRISASTQERVKENVRQIFAAADVQDAGYIKSRLLCKCRGMEGSHDLPLILKEGGEAWKQSKKDLVSNQGFVAALILSVILTLALTPLERDELDDDSSLQIYHDVYLCLGMVITILCIMIVINSVLYALVIDTYCIDLGDFLKFQDTQVDGFTTYSLLIVLILTCEAVGCGAVVILRDPLAHVMFGISNVAIIAIIYGGLMVLLPMRRQATHDALAMGDTYTQTIEEVWSEVFPKDSLCSVDDDGMKLDSEDDGEADF